MKKSVPVSEDMRAHFSAIELIIVGLSLFGVGVMIDYDLRRWLEYL